MTSGGLDLSDIAAKSRAVLDRLLAEFDASNACAWPPLRQMRIEFGTAVIDKVLTTLPPGAVYVEGNTLRASLLGMLSSTQGAEVEDLVVRYLQFCRSEVRRDSKREFVTSDEVIQALGLSHLESRRLSQALLLGNLWSGQHRPGGTQRWIAGIPDAIVDLMADDADFFGFVRRHATQVGETIAVARGWRPATDSPVRQPKASAAERDKRSATLATGDRAVVLLGASFGGLTLLFFMLLVVAGLLGVQVSPASRFLVVTVLALGCGLSSGFLGGHVRASGKLPIRLPEGFSPLTFGASGGFAVTLLALVLGWTLYAGAPQPKSGLELSHFGLESIDQRAGGLAVDTDTLRLSWSADGPPEDIDVALENVQTGRTSAWQHIGAGTQEATMAPDSYRALLAERAASAFNRVRIDARTGRRTIRSQEFRLEVGLTIAAYLNTRASSLTLATLIDNSAVQDYDFEVKAVFWARHPPHPISVGGKIRTKASFRIERPDDIDWDGIRIQYFGPGDPRVVRTMRLIDD